MKTFYFIIIFLVCQCMSIQAQIACKSDIVLSISIDGTAYITPADILASPMNASHRYILSRSSFNCADVNNTYTVIVSEYNGSTFINSCFSNVTVVNRFAGPLPCAPIRAWCGDGTYPLRSDGELTITPEMLARGPVNPAFNYTVTPSHFDCSNLGINTVSVTVTSTNNVSLTCSADITITNPYALFSPCYRLLARFFRPLPSNIFINNVRPGTPVPFELEIAKSKEIKKQINGQLVMVLSKDQIVSKDDKVLFSKEIKFTNKDQSIGVNNKFAIPSDIDLGEYYFIMDVVSNDKKENIGFEKYILPIQIGNDIDIKENRTKKSDELMDDISIFPNPVIDFLTINANENETSPYEIYNTVGKRISTNVLTGAATHVDVSLLPPGLYMLKIKGYNIPSRTIKFIKTN